METSLNKKSKFIGLATVALMASGFLFSTGINAHADEVVATPTQSQTTLTDIESDNNTSYDGEHSIQRRSAIGAYKILERNPHSKWYTKNAPTPWSVIKGWFHH